MQLIVHHEGKSGQNLKAGTWMQELKQKLWKVLLNCLPSLFSCVLQGHLFRDGTIPSGLSPPIINEKNHAIQIYHQAL